MKNGEKLIGQYKVKVIGKGRIAFPKKLRQIMGKGITVTRGYDGCLVAISNNEWNSLVSGIVKKPFLFTATRETSRFILGNAAKVDLDDQGRFIVPEHLRNYGEIKDEVIFLGLGKYIEIWNKNKWNDYQKYLEKNIKNISEGIENVEKPE